MTYVIKFDNGSYNQGNGHEVRLVEATRYETHQEAEAKTAELCGVLKIMNVAVHETHCCVDHGCKYGDHDCPVASGEVEQKYVTKEKKGTGWKVHPKDYGTGLTVETTYEGIMWVADHDKLIDHINDSLAAKGRKTLFEKPRTFSSSTSLRGGKNGGLFVPKA